MLQVGGSALQARAPRQSWKERAGGTPPEQGTAVPAVSACGFIQAQGSACLRPRLCVLGLPPLSIWVLPPAHPTLLHRSAITQTARGPGHLQKLFNFYGNEGVKLSVWFVFVF